MPLSKRSQKSDEEASHHESSFLYVADGICFSFSLTINAPIAFGACIVTVCVLYLPLLLIHPGVHDSGSTLPTPTIDPCFSSTLHSSLTTITTTSTPATPQLPLAFIAEHMGCVDKTLRLRLSHYAPFLQILCLKA